MQPRDLCDQARKVDEGGVEINANDGPVEIYHKIDFEEKNFIFNAELLGHLKRSDMYSRYDKEFVEMFASLVPSLLPLSRLRRARLLRVFLPPPSRSFDAYPAHFSPENIKKHVIQSKSGEDDVFIDLYEYLEGLRKYIPPFKIKHDSKADYSNEHKNFRPLEVFAFMDQSNDHQVSAYEFKSGIKMTTYSNQVDKDIWERNWNVLLWRVINKTHDHPSKAELKKFDFSEAQLKETWLDFDNISRWYRVLREYEELREELKGTGSGSMQNAFGLEYDSDDDTATNSLIMKAVHKTLLVGKDGAQKTDFKKIWNAYDKNRDHVLDRRELLKLLSDLLYGLRDHVHKMKLSRDKTGFWNQKQHLLRQEVEKVRRNIMNDPQSLLEKFFECFNIRNATRIEEKQMWEKRKKLCDFIRSRLRQFEMHLARAMQSDRKE